MIKPKTFAALVRAGGPDRFVREAAKQAARAEQQQWLAVLERKPVPDDAAMAALHANYIRNLRRQLALGGPFTVVQEQTRERVGRKRALGDWGETKAADLLKRAGFRDVRDMNAESFNHPFGDIFAERDGAGYLIGVKTQNKYQASGLINPTYNVRKRGADVQALAQQYNATLAWVAISAVESHSRSRASWVDVIMRRERPDAIMQTNFTAAQLRDPRIAEANAILQTCVHYGFCTNTCPTYVLTRDEKESPRGRIDLIRAMLEKGGPPEPDTVRHLDNCLSCLSCMTTCAVKVDYVHLIDRAREHIEGNFRRPAAERLVRALLARVLPRPRVFGAALALGRLARPLRKLLPHQWQTMLDMIPGRVAPDVLAPQVFRAEGAVRKRVALLAGCAQQALNGEINAATIRLLRRHGCEVVLAPGSGCCGSLNLHMGREEEARAFGRQNIRAWETVREGGLDALVINASGCGTTVKDYGHLFAREPGMARLAANIAALARDVSEFLWMIGLCKPSADVPAYRVAYHDPCSMQHVQKVIEQPRALLRAAGFQVVDVPERHFCCGSAGTYNLLQPDMAKALGERKAAHIRSTDPDIVATGNIGCMTQLGHYLGRPIVHTVELLDWATGGPKPRALKGVTLREPAAAAPAEVEAAASTGIW